LTYQPQSAIVDLPDHSSNGESKEPEAMGRGKVQIKKIENTTSRQVTFCKRKNGLLKKAYELSLLCDAEVALVIFSSSGRIYEFANKSVHATTERYMKANAENMPQARALTQCNYWQEEIRGLTQQRDILIDSIRKIIGEDLDSLSMKELKDIEIQLEKSISRVRSKKNEMLLGEIQNLQRKDCLLRAENQFLRSKIERSEGCPTKPDQLEVTFAQNFLRENTAREAQQHSQTTSVVIQTALQLG